MRFTSRRRRTAALALVGPALLAATPAGAVRPEKARLPCLLVKAAPESVPAEEAKAFLDGASAGLARSLSLRWVAPRPEPDAPAPYPLVPAPAGDPDLRMLSRAMFRAGSLMERLETEEAERLLRETQSTARGYRFDDPVRKIHAEIFLRLGILALWKGDGEGALREFARARALWPSFEPDPALYSPAIRESWVASGEAPLPAAELLVRTIPPGATVRVDGNSAGTSPGRIRVPAGVILEVRLEAPEFLPRSFEGQWLPGDVETVEAALPRDPFAEILEMLQDTVGPSVLSERLREMTRANGTDRAAILVLSGPAGERSLRVLAYDRPGDTLAELGSFPVREPGDLPEEVVLRFRNAGWPMVPEDEKRPWYYSYWFWTIVGITIAGAVAAAAGSGGGGDSGGSTGTIGVNF